jgi:hypothetical protein
MEMVTSSRESSFEITEVTNMSIQQKTIQGSIK